MNDTKLSRQSSDWYKPLILIAAAAFVASGCKTEASVSTPPAGGIPMPPSMPSPSGGQQSPSGGQQSPPGGQQSPSSGSESGSSGSQSGSSGSSGSPGGMPPSGGSEGGSQGGGLPESGMGGESGTSAGQGGSAGGVGEIPPPPSQQGGGGAAGEAGATSGEGGEGGEEENPFADADAEGGGECGDSGAMPGGIGGMGQAGECLESGGGGSSSSSESSSSASSSASGGGAQGGGAQGGGAQGGGAEGGGMAGNGAQGGSTGTGGAGGMGEFPGESDAERAARLGRELDESIGGFDEALQEEQRAIAAAGRVTEGFDLGEEGGGSGGGLISLGTQGASANSEAGMVGGNGPVDEESAIAGMTQEEISSRTPEDIHTVIDDDIIARQLREAALVEEDPVLREKLWNEYRKYKGVPVVE